MSMRCWIDALSEGYLNDNGALTNDLQVYLLAVLLYVKFLVSLTKLIPCLHFASIAIGVTDPQHVDWCISQVEGANE